MVTILRPCVALPELEQRQRLRTRDQVPSQDVLAGAQAQIEHLRIISPPGLTTESVRGLAIEHFLSSCPATHRVRSRRASERVRSHFTSVLLSLLRNRSAYANIAVPGERKLQLVL
jgi:hypothetical protein